MNPSVCGADCTKCEMRKQCEGCVGSNCGCSDKQCMIADYIAVGGMERYEELKQTLIAEINALRIPGMAEVTELYPLVGKFVNLEYPIPGGGKAKFLNDNHIYLGNQVACAFDAGRCYGVIAGTGFLLICEYDEGCQNPELVLYQRR